MTNNSEVRLDLAPLLRRLPERNSELDNGTLLGLFLDYTRQLGVDLYPAQEEAMLALYDGGNVILSTPTGSGKSLVATALHFLSLAQGRRSVYTCPIKALVNEKFLALCQDFGADQVGMITGDATVNRSAPILCCTAEILANIALSEGCDAPVDDIIMDEFHYYSDRERGVAWQVPMLTLTRARFLLMSATFGDTDFFESCLHRLTGYDTTVVKSNERPVPLDFIYQESLLHETIRNLVQGGKAPVYLVNFTQRDCAEEAQNLLSMDFCSKEEKQAIAQVLIGVKFSSPYGKDVQKLLRHGIGLHHAGLLPRYRLLVEQLAQKGFLKIISGTDTLGVGINVPIRTVLFTKLCKFDGSKATILNVRDFQQISGRAGRKGFDDRGTIVVQAPEHVIENSMLVTKAGGDAKKLRKIVKRKPPGKGYVHWDVNTFNRLISAPSEPLVSRFNVTYGMLLNILSRPGDGCQAMRQLIRDCHETPLAKHQIRKTAFQMFRSLVERDIIQFELTAESRRKKLVIDSSLQTDFSLNQALSLYLLDTLKEIDSGADDFALDLLTLIESILENPDVILRKQLARIKTLKMAQMKADGIEYDERIAELERLEYPKPNREFIYETFNRFAAAHPWVGNEHIRPKSIAREMYETFQSFDEYIRDYDQQRAEGLLLRYLTEVYKVLVQTVPEHYRNEEIESMIDYFGTMIRNIDSSLLDEWEKMRNPDPVVISEQVAPEAPLPPDVTSDMRTFTALIRNVVFRFIRAMAARDYQTALTLVEISDETSWTSSSLEALMEEFYSDHEEILTDRGARHPQLARLKNRPGGWIFEQTLADSDEHNDWQAVFAIDEAQSRDQGRPLLQLLRLGEIESR